MKNLFINLSNHPSSDWSVDQLSSANSYGKIIDIDFPLVDEDADEERIYFLVGIYEDKIAQLSNNAESVTIHVMGEMTFTFALVTKLKAAGYKCVASTTKRIVEILPDGSKNVKFEFCKFREY